MSKERGRDPRPGESLFGITTGLPDPLASGSSEAVVFIAELDGFVGAHPEAPLGMLWLFDTLDHATEAAVAMHGRGVKTGENVGEFKVAGDGVPEFLGGIEGAAK